jgi:hypothetical protein
MYFIIHDFIIQELQNRHKKLAKKNIPLKVCRLLKKLKKKNHSYKQVHE